MELGFPAALVGLELGGTGAGLDTVSPARSIRVLRFPRYCGGGMADIGALLVDAVIS